LPPDPVWDDKVHAYRKDQGGHVFVVSVLRNFIKEPNARGWQEGAEGDRVASQDQEQDGENDE